MNTKRWIFLFSTLFLLCAILTAILYRPTYRAQQAEIYQDGVLVTTVSLAVPQSFTIHAANGENTITVENGRLAITSADCPDQCCVQRGWCDSGPDLICLPHHLLIRFSDTETTDAMTGHQ